jgi:hypothetical protein
MRGWLMGAAGGEFKGLGSARDMHMELSRSGMMLLTLELSRPSIVVERREENTACYGSLYPLQPS